MRNLPCLLGFVLVLSVTAPAQAQLRQDAREIAAQSTPRLFDAGTGFTLNRLFSPQHFKMGHSYELSAGSMGGNSYSLGLYTNSLMWQFSQKVAARVDLSVAHSPFGNAPGMSHNVMGEEQPFRFFVQNAEVAYRPTSNMELRFSYHQSPYGGYYSPYGYAPYGQAFGAQRYLDADRLFWRESR